MFYQKSLVNATFDPPNYSMNYCCCFPTSVEVDKPVSDLNVKYKLEEFDL